MAAALTVTRTIEQGEYAMDFIKILMDSTYPAGGEVISGSPAGAGYFAASFDVSTTGYVASWDAANQKIKVWYSDNNNAADGPLIENATADISAETFTGRAWRLK